MWPRLFAVLIVGYLSVSRAFAYVGIPTWKVFIGEVVLALSFLWGPGMNGKVLALGCRQIARAKESLRNLRTVLWIWNSSGPSRDLDGESTSGGATGFCV